MSRVACLLLPLLALFTSGCLSMGLASLFESELEEVIVEDGGLLTRNKIAVLDLSGVISSEMGGMFSRYKCTPETVRSMLDMMREDGHIRGVLLRIDSPGGEVTATDMIFREIRNYQQETGVPVYASMMGLSCSGGYYLSCVADRIYAHPTTITGSIGVIARFPKMRGLADKVGYDEEIVKSGDMKAMGHPLLAMSEEERAVFQGTIDNMYRRFITIVRDGRPKLTTLDAVRPIADGRIYTAEQALENGLIDEIAYLSEAIDGLKAAVGIRKAHVVTYSYGGGDDANIYTRAMRAPVELNMGALQLKGVELAKPGFHYLWLPGE
jgi:protease-4